MKTLERLVLAHLRPLVSSFMDPLQWGRQRVQRTYSGLCWTGCLRNNLQINASKTKELVVDFHSAGVATLRLHRLDWTHNTDALVKKGNNSRLFLLRRLRSFGVQGPLLRTFYDSVVASAIFYGIVCWASSITDRDRRRMDRLDTALTALGSSFSERLLHFTLCEGEVPQKVGSCAVRVQTIMLEELRAVEEGSKISHKRTENVIAANMDDDILDEVVLVQDAGNLSQRSVT
ncbi:hypothetical protein L3Q82_000674 [Scortum barcoo]|uniref:Uncharacterized protein n=1 Tax=Scortum barcoo TaxID=214431 RepID=A0ACB8WFT9_9TELE|nr:hypothetical protein L3Q82_000674 [Scortum barcoo]